MLIWTDASVKAWLQRRQVFILQATCVQVCKFSIKLSEKQESSPFVQKKSEMLKATARFFKTGLSCKNKWEMVATDVATLSCKCISYNLLNIFQVPNAVLGTTDLQTSWGRLLTGLSCRLSSAKWEIYCSDFNEEIIWVSLHLQMRYP